MKGISAALPLSTDGVDGPYTLNKNILEVARQNLKVLFFTNPGERVFNSKFGVGLRRSLFENNTLSLQTSIISRIRSQVGSYLPYIDILEINIVSPLTNPNMDENSISLIFTYSVNTTKNSETLFLDLGGKGGLSIAAPQQLQNKFGNFISGAPSSGRTANGGFVPWDSGKFSVINVPY